MHNIKKGLSNAMDHTYWAIEDLMAVKAYMNRGKKKKDKCIILI